MGPLTDTPREKETEKDGSREAGGDRGQVGTWVLVFMANLVYKVKSALYRFNLPVTARPLFCSLPHNSLSHHPPYLPSPQVVSR